MRYFCFILIGLLWLNVLKAKPGQQPGDIYKEYAVNLRVDNNWRVTDPLSGQEGAQDFLPNPVLVVGIDDMEGAVRAEVLMEIWGGHPGTTGLKFRFNWNEWIDIPGIESIPGQQECYTKEYNVILDIPLDQLKEGDNSFEGTSGGQICHDFDWGQWGWYAMIVRVYYGAETDHVEGRITSPAGSSLIGENPEIRIQTKNDKQVRQVQVLGKYLGYDENGDGIYYDWHRSYHGPGIENHIGTITEAPFTVTWNTEFVPDQKERSIQLLARIQDENGCWYVTEVVDNLSLERAGASVKMYTAYDIPDKFWVRDGEKKGCKILIENLEQAGEALFLHRTWNGGKEEAAVGIKHKPVTINNWSAAAGGEEHFYALSEIKVPVEELLEGINNVWYESTTVHHGIEILWPGPAIIVRYDK